MTVLTGVSGHFSAAHHGPDGKVHGHTWEVLAWFSHRGPADARCDKAALDMMLAQLDHTMLPDDLAWGEDIARRIGVLANCVEVVVSRPREGYHAKWTCPRKALSDATGGGV